VAQVVAGSSPSGARWDFIGDDGVSRRVSDLAIEVFQNWGDPNAWNVWQNRQKAETQKQARTRAMRRGRTLPLGVSSPGEKTEQ